MHRMCIHKKMAQGRTICDGALKKETRREKRESKTGKDSVAGGRYGGTATLPGGPRTSAWGKATKEGQLFGWNGETPLSPIDTAPEEVYI